MIIILLILYIYLCHKKGAFLTWRPFVAALKRLLKKFTEWLIGQWNSASQQWHDFHFITPAGAADKTLTSAVISAGKTLSSAIGSAEKLAVAATHSAAKSGKSARAKIKSGVSASCRKGRIRA